MGKERDKSRRERRKWRKKGEIGRNKQRNKELIRQRGL
jgi:hypothetical protein